MRWEQVYDEVVSRRDPGVVLVDARPAEMYSDQIIRQLKVQHIVKSR